MTDRGDETPQPERVAGEPPFSGRLSQDVERLFPQLVRTDEHGQKHVTAYPLIGVLIEAVKELDRRLAELESKRSGRRDAGE